MRIFIFNLVIIILFSPLAYSQPGPKKELKALRITEKPKIDGNLDDPCWQNANAATDFIQFEPYNGAEPTFQTIVKVAYDDNAIYIGAMMYDPEPEKIMRELGQRDDGELNADNFVALISPYNDGLNSLDFELYASGVQLDVKEFSDGEDASWDAVWKSACQNHR